jgi:hypothetical protein
MTELTIHPIASLIPGMDDEEYENLKRSIQAFKSVDRKCLSCRSTDKSSMAGTAIALAVNSVSSLLPQR